MTGKILKKWGPGLKSNNFTYSSYEIQSEEYDSKVNFTYDLDLEGYLTQQNTELKYYCIYPDFEVDIINLTLSRLFL